MRDVTGIQRKFRRRIRHINGKHGFNFKWAYIRYARVYVDSEHKIVLYFSDKSMNEPTVQKVNNNLEKKGFIFIIIPLQHFLDYEKRKELIEKLFAVSFNPESLY